MATATASAWFSSGRLGAHPPASPAPYSKLARDPATHISAALTRRPAAISEPGNAHSRSAARVRRRSRHRTDTRRIGLPRPATPSRHKALRDAIFLPLHAAYIAGGNRIQRRVGAFVEVGLDDFDSLVCGRTASIRAKPATRKPQTKRGHGKLRPQPSPPIPSRSWTPSAAQPARSASISILSRSTRLSGRLRPTDVALQMRQRPALSTASRASANPSSALALSPR